MGVTELLREAETLCRQIVPDLKGHPLYIVPHSLLPPEFSLVDKCYGYTLPALDRYVQPYVEWQGRGPAMIVADNLLSRDSDTDEDMTTAFIATVLHELAHVLDRKTFAGERIYPSEPIEREVDAVLQTAMKSEDEYITKLPPYYKHGKPFIRACIHLRHRAEQAGYYQSISNLFYSRLYELSSGSAYQRALGDEPRIFDNQPIRAVLKLEPPKPFQNLWISDIAAINSEDEENE